MITGSAAAMLLGVGPRIVCMVHICEDTHVGTKIHKSAVDLALICR